MNATIDTLATYEAIAAAGIDDRGARAISKAIADSLSAYREDLATKVDIAELQAATKADSTKLATDLVKLEAKLDTRISEVKELIASTQNKTIIWMFGMLVTFAGIIIGVLKLT